jgi:SAM-dependent methyltransferase
MNDEGREKFFALGTRYIEFVLGIVNDRLDPGFRPTRALDFGCGVGRLAIPLARKAEAVVGVDVSEGMLAEARLNAERMSLKNLSFVRGDDTLSAVEGTFDFLNSLIVFQHIPPHRGERILARMLGMLREGGVGALQFTYSYEAGFPRSRHALIGAYKSVPFVWNVRNLVKGAPLREPMMQMNEYDLNRLFRMLQEGGCHMMHPCFTETSSFGRKLYGVILIFKKTRMDTTAHA